MQVLKYPLSRSILLLIPVFSFFTSLAQAPDAEVISAITNIELQDSRRIEKNSYTIRINNRNGDKYAEIAIPFSKSGALSDLQAYILDDKGIKVKTLKKSDIVVRSDNSDQSFYNDNYIKEFSLRNNTYPYTLVYSYQENVDQFLYLAHWTPVVHLDIPTQQAKLSISVPKNYPVFFRCNKIDPPKADTIGDYIYYEWKSGYTEQVSPETFSPSVWEFLPYVKVIPSRFKYENEGSQDSWIDYGNWNLSLKSLPDELPTTEINIIHHLTDNIPDTLEKIKALYTYLQKNTRYINVSIKTGGMKPYPAAYVAEKKYGDCKALANYFQACLASIGIESYYSTINAGTEIEPIDTTLPSQQFNHVILFVPLHQDTLWLDCTSDLAFGYLGTFTQNRPALVLDHDRSKLVNTPALSFNDVKQNRCIRALVNSDESLQCEFTGIYRGYQYELLSQISTELSETDRKSFLSRNLTETGFQLENFTFIQPADDTPAIGLHFSATSGQYVKTYGNESLLKVIPFELPVIEAPSRRKLPLQLSYPIYKIDTVNYTLPSNFKISALPENKVLKSGYGDYRVNFSQQGQTAQVIKELKLKACNVPLNEYAAFYKFYNELIEFEKSLYITLTSSSHE